jgi:hypothetical protein
MDEYEKEVKRSRGKKAGYIITIIVNGVLVFVLNSLSGWNVPFLTQEYSLCLWAVNLSLGATMVANFIFIFYERQWFTHLLQVFTSIAAFIAFYIVNEIFPFIFLSSIWYTLLRIFLIAGMVISGLSVIYNIIRTILPFSKKIRQDV